MTDADALSRYVRFADAEAFAALVRRYESLVFGVCIRQLGRGADAEDATQLTFMKLARAATTIQNKLEGTLGAWLHTTAARTALDLGRQRGVRKKHEAAAARASDAAPAANGVVDAAALAELSEEVDAAMLELDDKQRALIVDIFFRGQSQRQVAKSRGVCQARICRELKAAVAALRSALSRRGVLVPAGVLTASLTAVREAAAGLVVPAEATAGCVKVGLSGVGSELGGGLLAPSSPTAWPALAPPSAGMVGAGSRGLVFWLLVAAVAVGLGMAILGGFGFWSHSMPRSLAMPHVSGASVNLAD